MHVVICDVVRVGAGHTPEDHDTTETSDVAVGDVVVVKTGSTYGTVGDRYKYVDLASAGDLTNQDLSIVDYVTSSDWVKVAGTLGSAYKYVGPAPSGNLDLTAQDYTNSLRWREITGDEGAAYAYIGTSGSIAPGSENYNDATRWTKLGAGGSAKVRIGTDYEVENYTTAQTSAVAVGEIVKVVTGYTGPGGTLGSLYKYAGATDLTSTVLNTVNYTTTDWDEISGDAGAVYRYVGSSAEIVDFDAVDYEGSSNWEKVTQDTADYIPNIGNVTGSDSVGIGGLVVRNDVRSDVDAYIDNASVAAGGDILVSALEDASIQAVILSTVSSSGGSAFGTGTSLAISGTIATNLVLSSATATVTNSTLGTSSTPIGGNVEVTADSTSGIDATVLSSTSTGDTAVGVTLAFNTIGWESQNLLFNAIDALLGDTILGNAQPAEVEASVEDSTLYVAGDLTVEAHNDARLNATVSNAATSEASALFGATGMSASAILASNKVNARTWAAVEDTDTTGTTSVTVGGDVTIRAEENAGIFSNSKVVSSSSTTKRCTLGRTTCMVSR